MYKIYFDISEYIINPEKDSVPLHVADKIVEHHISIINPIRIELDVPVFVSKNSGFRSYKWEIDHGRDGDSQHTYGDGQEHPELWLGAADYSCSKLLELWVKLQQSAYKRVIMYPNKKFIHCDHKGQFRVAYESVNGVLKPLERLG
jgi:hypothetical protein